MSSVDVIVPCYRYGHFLRECVESALSQSGVDIRVLIIDDASPDNTAEVAEKLKAEDSRVIFIKHKLNKGHILTYNEGLEWASAEYLLLLSADDYILPDALSRAVKLMDQNRQIGFTFGGYIELSSNNIVKKVIPLQNIISGASNIILQGREFIELSGAHNIVRTPTAVVRTQLQKKVGGYRLELPHAGDMEMWLRLAARGSVGVLGTHQAVYRIHADNMFHAYLDSALPDLYQRKAAIDYFIEDCSDAFADSQVLHRRLYKFLGYAAIDWANSAFGNGDVERSLTISHFAVTCCPEVKRSLPWIKLTCKRTIGLRGWCALQPTLSRIRNLLSSRASRG
jgi:glycosyltransferase involved in cell wall biosynthesis